MIHILAEMAVGSAIIMVSGKGPTGSGHIFIQQKEAAKQLHADDMITLAANGEVEQVQRRATQLQKHPRQIRLYSLHRNRKKNTSPHPEQHKSSSQLFDSSSPHYSLFWQRTSQLIKKRPSDRHVKKPPFKVRYLKTD